MVYDHLIGCILNAGRCVCENHSACLVQNLLTRLILDTARRTIQKYKPGFESVYRGAFFHCEGIARGTARVNADISVQVDDHGKRLIVPKLCRVVSVTTTPRAFVLHNFESSLGPEIIN